jgi:serine/threonine protein kinase
MDRETISHYRLLGKLGSGGMGVVYAAEDMKLGRKVALKFLTAEYSHDPVALRRFEREAQTASALNHPNICTIYEIDECDGYRFMAMELLKGVTLRDRIARERLQREELLDFAIQIVSGLEAAHSQEIIHRDIKPANIFVTDLGYVKLLDFGLAKLSEDQGSSVETLAGETLPTEMIAREHLTTPGVALGTVAYMSPEQALGEKLDARTDLFSFGAVLYQMATGRHAFAGNTSLGTVDAILHKAPLPIARLNPDMPPELQSIVSKALEKDRKLRYQTATDLRCDLQRAKRDSQPLLLAVTEDESTETLPEPPPKRAQPTAQPELKPKVTHKKRNLMVGAGVLAVIVLAVLGVWWRARTAAAAEAYLRIQTNPGAQLLVDETALGVAAADGTVTVRVTPGRHSVQLNLKGYEAYSTNINVNGGEREGLVAALSPIPPPSPPPTAAGDLLVRSNVAGADVIVDGQSKGSTGNDKQLQMQLNEGTHKIQLKKPGYQDSPEQQVEITAKKDNQASFTLAAAEVPVPDTYLTIKSKPGAEVRLDDKVSGVVDGEHALQVKTHPGKHLIQISLSGYEPFSSSVTAKSGAKTYFVADLKPLAPTVTSFSTSQSKVEAGQTANLKWATQNATEIRIEPGIGTVSPNGARDVSPTQTTTYILTAKGSGGSTTAKVNIAVEAKLPSPSDVQSIKETLARFKGAYDSMDINALRREWPSLTQTQADAIKTTFVGLSSLRLNDNCDGLPAISGDTAEWTCHETINYVIKGQHQIPAVRNTITYHLKKGATRWYVDRREGAANVSAASGS